MKPLSQDELKLLAETQSEKCDSVSIFMSTKRGSIEIKQNPARLKNLLDKAEEKLSKVFPRTVDARRFLSPVNDLLNEGAVWDHPSDGLAVFLSKDMFRYYLLPLDFEECVVVCKRFHIKPLLPLFSGDGRFYVLALSQKRVRLLRCTRYEATAIDLAGIVPGSLVEAAGTEETVRSVQYHAGAPGIGKESVVFHGHGPEKTTEKHITLFFREINRGLCREMLKEEDAPLVLAGVGYLHPIYEKVNTYKSLFEKGITGNPDDLSSDELHHKAWDLVQPFFDMAKSEAIDEYRELVGTGHTSTNIEEIIPSAYAGGVEKLFLALDTHRWGTFDQETRAVKLHEKAESCDADLVDLATAYTITHRGEVYVVKPEEIPNILPLAAVFRHERHNSRIGHGSGTSGRRKKT